MTACIAAQQEPLCVTENGCERITQFVHHAGQHLPERGELFGLQKLGLKNMLRGHIAIDFDAPEQDTMSIQYGARRAFKHPRRRPR